MAFLCRLNLCLLLWWAVISSTTGQSGDTPTNSDAHTTADPLLLPPSIYIPIFVVLVALVMFLCGGFTILCYRQTCGEARRARTTQFIRGSNHGQTVSTEILSIQNTHFDSSGHGSRENSNDQLSVEMQNVNSQAQETGTTVLAVTMTEDRHRSCIGHASWFKTLRRSMINKSKPSTNGTLV